MLIVALGVWHTQTPATAASNRAPFEALSPASSQDQAAGVLSTPTIFKGHFEASEHPPHGSRHLLKPSVESKLAERRVDSFRRTEDVKVRHSDVWQRSAAMTFKSPKDPHSVCHD